MSIKNKKDSRLQNYILDIFTIGIVLLLASVECITIVKLCECSCPWRLEGLCSVS